MNRPRSMGPEPSVEKSSLPQWENTAFGSGAITNVRATSKGSQFEKRAHERIIIKNPTANTKESKMTVFIPACVIFSKETQVVEERDVAKSKIRAA